jgi:hypothetical protein
MAVEHLVRKNARLLLDYIADEFQTAYQVRSFLISDHRGRQSRKLRLVGGLSLEIGLVVILSAQPRQFVEHLGLLRDQ